jgi:hypothetical protein
MDEKQIQEEGWKLRREALELADRALKSIVEAQRMEQRREERHQEELRQAESRREGIFPPLFSR